MKTITDFKRRLTIGAKVHTIYHQVSAGRDEKGVLLLKDEDKGEREVSRVQSNSFALKTTKTDGTTTDSWCNYPKLKECIFHADGDTITLLSEDFRRDSPTANQLIPVLTYKFLQP